MSIRRPRLRPHPADKDSGAALLLAIGTVLMISAITGGLAAAATSSLQNRTTLEQVRNREYAADGAVEQAIATVRASTYTCTTPGSFFEYPSVNGVAIRVDWVNDCSSTVTTSDGTPYQQRNVVFSACPNAGVTCVDSPGIVIRAEVDFEPATGDVTKTFVQSWSVNR